MTQQVPQYERTYQEPTGWTGWIFFAAVMLMIGGGLNAFYGLVAILRDDLVVWNSDAALVVDLTTWGWILLIAGILAFLCGIGLLTGNMVARVFGVIFACLSMFVNFFFLPVYPFWAITIIVIDAMVIWAITVHGREMKESA